MPRHCAGIGLGLAIGLGLSSVAETLLINQYFHILFRISLHTKVSTTRERCLSWSNELGVGARAAMKPGTANTGCCMCDSDTSHTMSQA